MKLEELQEWLNGRRVVLQANRSELHGQSLPGLRMAPDRVARVER